MPNKRININDIDSLSLAGGHILINILNKKKLNTFLDKKLGLRAPRANYSYSDAIYSWFVTKCRGIKSFESLDEVKHELKDNPKFKKGMSPDTLFYICKELSEKDSEPPKKTDTKQKAKNYQLNQIDKFNELLIELNLFLDVLNTREEYILDYDTTPIETRNKDARPWYGGKGRAAYCPAVAMINKIPIFIENRNGDTNPRFRLKENIMKIVELLKKHDIKIRFIRIDAAGCSKEFTDYATQNGIKYITKPTIATVRKHTKYIHNWKQVHIKNERLNVGSTYIQFGAEEQRLIVNFQDGADEQNESKSHWGLMTNIEDLSPKEIISLYRQRGTGEQMFSELNQLGWKYMRMHKFQYNTVYLYITGLNSIIHKYLKRVLSKKLEDINEKMEFDTFRNLIMRIPVMWFEGKLRIITKNPLFRFLSGFT